VNTADALAQALKDKADLENYRIPQRSRAELESLATADKIQKVVIHPDDSSFDSISEFGKQGAAITLSIAQKLQAQLKSKGINAVLTRTSAQRVPLGKELEIINGSGAQVLIIVSVGENPDFKELAGYRVLYVTESVDYTATKAGALESGENVPLDLNYRSFQTGNRMLGTALNNALRDAVNREPIGINPAPLFLAKRAPMHSAAVVAGYLSNSADRRRLEDDKHQDELAAAIAQGITEFGGHMGQATSRITAGGQ